MHNTEETKNCQNCKNDFIIEPDDFSLYEKIKVPPPTFCPECRMIHLLLWRNFRFLFKRICGSCGKSLISMYPEDKIKTVYCIDCWNSDNRDPFLQGKDYDFSKNFFEQLKNLMDISPFVYNYHAKNVVRSDYTNYCADDKDCYLSFSIVDCENVYYSELIDKSKNTFDCYGGQKMESSSYNIDCDTNNNCHYMINSSKCIDSHFLFDCINCQNCSLSYNLRNQQYVFKNNKLSKEEYEKEISTLELNSYLSFKKILKYFEDNIKNKAIHRFAQIYNSYNAVGDYIYNSKDVRNSFDVQSSENVFNCSRVLMGTKDCYDGMGIAQGELIYQSIATSFSTYKDSFCYISIGSRECEYCLSCRNCKNCFGCIGLTNNQYCIFNKQYEKDGYNNMVEKIKKQMSYIPYFDGRGNIYKYGEFFPPMMTPFAYNLSTANDFLPTTKERVIEMGYPWNDRAERTYEVTIKSEDLPDGINDTPDSIIEEVISCPSNGNQNFQCSSAYKIIPDELQFYKQKNLPLPRYCPNCRHYQILRFRNPIRLYDRTCMRKGCDNTFKTTYAPDKSETVYCENCYKKEVY